MANFIQIHGLTIYAPSNLNRDDTGRPKTARFGGAERLRISSQALKRAIRTSDAFKARVGEHRGARTARAGELIKAELLKRQIAEEKATAIAKTISAIVGTPDNGATNGRIQNKELYFMAPEERLALLSMVESIVTDDEMANELAAAAGSVVDDEAPDEAVTSTKKKDRKRAFPKRNSRHFEKKLS